MAARMMQAEATKNQSLNMEQLMNLFGRYFQLRDDYQDLSSVHLHYSSIPLDYR
jgi:geranylgeranyl pyrophosphate synthase